MLSTKMQIGKLMSEIRKIIFKLDAPRFWWNSVQYSLVFFTRARLKAAH